MWPGRNGKGSLVTKALYRYLVGTLQIKATVHGFRSSFRDWCGNETHFDRVSIESCLAHAAGDATELAYRRSDALEKRRVIMQEWAKYCEGPTAHMGVPNAGALLPLPQALADLSRPSPTLQ